MIGYTTDLRSCVPGAQVNCDKQAGCRFALRGQNLVGQHNLRAATVAGTPKYSTRDRIWGLAGLGRRPTTVASGLVRQPVQGNNNLKLSPVSNQRTFSRCNASDSTQVRIYRHIAALNVVSLTGHCVQLNTMLIPLPYAPWAHSFMVHRYLYN